MNLALFKKYGVAPRHITKLVPVSRTTASVWVNGRDVPSTYFAERMAAIQRAIRTAEKYGEFPVPTAFKGTVRDQYVVTIIRKYTEGPGKELAQES